MRPSLFLIIILIGGLIGIVSLYIMNILYIFEDTNLRLALSIIIGYVAAKTIERMLYEKQIL